MAEPLATIGLSSGGCGQAIDLHWPASLLWFQDIFECAVFTRITSSLEDYNGRQWHAFWTATFWIRNPPGSQAISTIGHVLKLTTARAHFQLNVKLWPAHTRACHSKPQLI